MKISGTKKVKKILGRVPMSSNDPTADNPPSESWPMQASPNVPSQGRPYDQDETAYVESEYLRDMLESKGVAETREYLVNGDNALLETAVIDPDVAELLLSECLPLASLELLAAWWSEYCEEPDESE